MAISLTAFAFLPVNSASLALIVTISLAVGGLLTSVIVKRHLSAILDSAATLTDNITNGDISEGIDQYASNESKSLITSLKRVQFRLQENNNDGPTSSENTDFIQFALNSMNKPVMIANADFDIIFLNSSASDLFNSHVADIRQELPKFDPANLLGANIDQFHKNPGHQRAMLSALQKTHVIDLKFGNLMLRITANPVFDKNGDRLGAVVEWDDRTDEIALEEEIKSVVDSALAGDLSRRISSIGEGENFTSMLSGGVNELMKISEQVVADTIRVFSAIARGNLTETIETDYKGTFGELKTDANATVGKLTEVVGDIQEAAGSVKSSAEQISQGNANLSDRTEQQASSLEETASSMTEMTTTVQQNAENAGQANQLAKEAREQAEKGGLVVGQAVDAMGKISDSSKKIEDIISVINEIAFQTNLLALNASVEAARAGEQGRGFAVVASEVRNLAGRSATAAKEIKELIQDSGSKVEEGARLVNESGEMLEGIVDGVKKVTDIVSEITIASTEQSSGISEVNRSISQMDEFTQSNAALVEEAAAASESLGQEAESLNQMMMFFTVGKGAGSNSSQAVERRGSERPWSGDDSGEQHWNTETNSALSS